MMRMPSASSRIQIGMMWPPQSANTRLTPRRFRRRAIRSAALSGRAFIGELRCCWIYFLDSLGSDLCKPGDEKRDGDDGEDVRGQDRTRGDAGLDPIKLGDGERSQSDTQLAQDQAG